MEQTIQVNFNRPMPLFPLASAVLLPHGVQQLHIFEKRYRQMIEDSLDGPGQIAMATFSEADLAAHEDQPELRPAVCVGQIVQHHRLPDGRFHVILLGICRARIASVEEPEGERLYRTAHLRLLEEGRDHAEMTDVREELRELLQTPSIQHIRGLGRVMQLFERDDVPTIALLELLGASLLEDPELRYRLLAEADPYRRAAIIRAELSDIDAVTRQAGWQLQTEWPKGMSWN